MKAYAHALAVFFCFLSGPRIASAANDLPALNTITTPDSPAFVQLGVSPTQIQRPPDARSFAAAIVPGVVSQNGLGVPPGFALEATPYWWSSHPTLTLDEYEKGGLASIYRNLAISVASTPAASTSSATSATSSSSVTTSSSAATATPQAALGLRTSLWRGVADDSDKTKCAKALKDINDAVDKAEATYILKNPTASADDIEKISLSARKDAAKDADLSPCAKQWWLRQGFSLDLAGAIALAMPNDQFNNAALSGYSGWLTGAILPSESDSILLLARYLATGLNGSSEQRTADFGARYIYAWSKFGVSVEALYRDYIKGDPTTKGYAVRATLGLDILVADNLWVTLTAGRDYAPIDTQPFLSLAGLKWNVDTGSSRTFDPTDDAKRVSDAVTSSKGSDTTPTQKAPGPAATPPAAAPNVGQAAQPTPSPS